MQQKSMLGGREPAEKLKEARQIIGE